LNINFKGYAFYRIYFSFHILVIEKTGAGCHNFYLVVVSSSNSNNSSSSSSSSNSSSSSSSSKLASGPRKGPCVT